MQTQYEGASGCQLSGGMALLSHSEECFVPKRNTAEDTLATTHLDEHVHKRRLSYRLKSVDQSSCLVILSSGYHAHGFEDCNSQWILVLEEVVSK
jgi:hypothetical protein